MERSRRSFLKIAGLSVLGLGPLPLVGAIAQESGATINPDPGSLEGKKWAMVVDTTKCKEGCVDCVQACHFLHNVPDIPDKTEEIKWIWHETYEHSFTEQQHDQVATGVEHRPFMLLCNHCTNPPCVRVCPTQATFKRADGIVLINRIKPHTNFIGATESGLIKMIAIGLGNQKGAEHYHRLSVIRDQYEIISSTDLDFFRSSISMSSIC